MTVKPAGTDGAPLGYLEYLPPGYGDGTPRPLLVFLHGAGESGSGDETALDAIFKLGIPRLIQDDEWPGDRPFIVLMPQYGVDDAEDCQLADEVDAFLAFANEQYDVDEERVPHWSELRGDRGMGLPRHVRRGGRVRGGAHRRARRGCLREGGV